MVNVTEKRSATGWDETVAAEESSTLPHEAEETVSKGR